MPQFDFMTGLSFLATMLGIASLIISSRGGALRAQLDEMKTGLAKATEDLKNLQARLLIVENDRDSYKRDADELRLKLIAALDENRALREQLSRIKAALRARAQRN